MDLRNQQIKETYGNLATINTVAGTPTTGVLQNGAGSNVTTLTIAGTLDATNVTGTLQTAAQTNITSVGTLTGLTVSGNANFDSGTLFVDASTDRVGIGTNSLSSNLRLNQKLAIVHAGQGTYAGMAITGYTGTDGYPVIDINRSRGTTDGTFTTLVDDDTVGAISFRGSDGTALRNVAAIFAEVDGTVGSNQVPGRMMFYTANSSGTNTERLRIDSSGNVGIGTTSPNISSGASGSTVLTLSATSSARNALIELKGTRTDNGDISTYIRSYNGSGATPITDIQSIRGATDTDGSLAFFTSNAERVRITDDGLTFNGDTAAANALDDYEEGTWTPGISFGGNSVGVTYSDQIGQYTKIGRKVTVTGIFILSNKGTSTGAARITGLPFNGGGTSGYYAAPVMRTTAITYSTNLNSLIDVGQNEIILQQVNNSTGVVTSLTDANFNNTSDILLTFTYFV